MVMTCWQMIDSVMILRARLCCRSADSFSTACETEALLGTLGPGMFHRGLFVIALAILGP